MATALLGRRSHFLIGGLATLVVATALLSMVAEALATPSRGNFQSIGATFRWEPLLIGLHLVTDILIGLSYVAIAATLMVLARKAGGSVSCVLRQSGERVVIDFRDSGHGVPPALQRAVFERFRPEPAPLAAVLK